MMDTDFPENFLDSEKTPQRKKLPEQLHESTDFSSPLGFQRMDDFEVTSVSRSGRVRKKSSKLMDFESNNEIIEKPKKKSQQAQKSFDRFDEPGPSGIISTRSVKNAKSSLSGRIKMETASSSTDTGSSESESEYAAPDENLGTDSESEANDDDTLMIDDIEPGFKRLEIPEREVTSQANSLYMLEKSKRRVIIKDGKTISKSKMQRKDKGKARFTAYMLWSKEVRQKLTEQCPDMDFATISKRLGELWSTVPNLEKCNWRRRAKRLMHNSHYNSMMRSETILKFSSPVRNKFINKARIPTESNISTTAKKTKQGPLASNVGNSSSSKNRHGEFNDSLPDAKMFKVQGTDPIDVAAHFVLLSESLTIIGELLMNHKGEVAISGGLSVLLDSLLCSLGTLICLTKQLPEANGAEPEILSKTLDNIAYIMPGL